MYEILHFFQQTTKKDDKDDETDSLFSKSKRSKTAKKSTKSTKSKDFSDSESDSDSSFSDMESGKKKRKGKKSKKGKKGKKDDSDSDSSGSDGDSSSGSDSDYSKSKKGKKKKGKSKKGKGGKSSKYSDSESDDSRSSRRGRGGGNKRGKGLNRSSSKRSLRDLDYSDDDYSYDSRDSRGRGGGGRGRRGRGGGGSRDGSRYGDDDDSFASRRSRNDLSRGRGRGGMQRSGSKKSLYDNFEDEDYFDERGLEMEDRRKSDRRKPPPPRYEESVRQARTVLKTVKNTKDEDVTVEVQQVMNTEMSALIAQLKTQREELENKLKDSETEATKLRIEREESKMKIVELETKKNDTEARMEETKKEVRELQAKNTLEIANQGAEKILVNAELEQVKKEREEMNKMIKKLEKAKNSLEERCDKATEEAAVLKTEKDVAKKRVTEVESEREALRARLSQIEYTRADIEAKLAESELEAKQLKEVKKMKTQEIRDMRTSHHNRSTINLAEMERKDITRNLKRVTEEKQQMLEMMAQLNASHNRLCDLVEVDECGFDDGQSLGMGSAWEPQPPNVLATSFNSSISGLSLSGGGQLSGEENERPAGWLGNEIQNRNMQEEFGYPPNQQIGMAGYNAPVFPDSSGIVNPYQQPIMSHGFQSMPSFHQGPSRKHRSTDPSERTTRTIGDLQDPHLQQREQDFGYIRGDRSVASAGLVYDQKPRRNKKSKSRSKDPSNGSLDGAAIQRKRDKARESEKRLRQKMQKSNPVRSSASTGGMSYASYDP